MKTVLHVINKLESILSTVWGWVLYLALAIGDYFAGHSFIIWLVIIVTLMDAGWGIAVSVHQGKFTLSELARLTIAKLVVYGCAMFVFVGLDRMASTTLSASVIGSAIVLIEFWSSSASMLILFPNFLFLKLLRKALTGEIAGKLGIPESEVESVLYGKKDVEENDKK